MPTKSPLEDLFAIAGDLLEHLASARHALKAQANGSAEGLARDLDLVSREEFDAAFAMLAKARARQEDMEKRVSKIESILKLSRVKKTVKTKKTNLRIVSTKKKLQARK
jgi:BMFP domain-containing protein YqiC